VNSGFFLRRNRGKHRRFLGFPTFLAACFSVLAGGVPDGETGVFCLFLSVSKKLQKKLKKPLDNA
jgi:hypothetical protein